MAKQPMTKKKKIIYIILGTLLLALIIFRLLLPSIVLKYVNKQLALIDGYYGHVKDIDISLYRGAYTIKTIYLNKTSGKIPVPFFKANSIDLSVEWKAIFNGKIVAEIEVTHPVLNFVNGPTKETSQTDIDNDWTMVVDKLLPIKLNRFAINKGEIHYKDYYSSPKVDIKSTNIDIVAENLTNAKHEKGALPSTVKASADVYEGKVTMDMKIDPLNKNPTFDMNAKLSTLKVTNLNDFLRAYGNFDVEKGTISIYAEAASKDKNIRGYAKPVIKDLQVLSWKKDKDKPLHLIWEGIIQGVSWLLTNHNKDQIATKAEFTGRTDDPNISIWVIIGQLLRNAFIQALYPSLENSVNINNIGKKEEKKTLLQKIFQGSDKKGNKGKTDQKKNK